VRKILLGGLLTIAVLAFMAWRAGSAPDTPYEQLEAKYAHPDSKYVDLAGGVRVHYRDVGDPSHPTIVLVHGYGDSFTSWDAWIPVLATSYRVIALDLPGHGLTRAPDDWTPSAATFLETLDGFAKATSLPRFVLAGNSMGGGIAWGFAIAHPERVRGLVLVDAAGWPLGETGPPPLAFRILQYRLGRWILERIDNRPLIAEGLKKDFHDPSLATEAFIDRWAAFQRAPGHRRILMKVPVGKFVQATPDLLAKVQAPTLVLHGESDAILPVEHGRKFAQAIPGAKLVTYPNVGHLPQIEHAEASAADVAAFVAALPAE
jgi:pimeloyl-ACP methyl ester carboxylesterase